MILAGILFSKTTDKQWRHKTEEVIPAMKYKNILVTKAVTMLLAPNPNVCVLKSLI